MWSVIKNVDLPNLTVVECSEKSVPFKGASIRTSVEFMSLESIAHSAC